MVLTACSEPAPPTATSEPTATAPREAAAPTASPSPEPTPTPSQHTAAPTASATPAPAQAPAPPEPTPTPTASPATGSRTVVVTTREEGVEEEAKGSGGLTPTAPKPPRTESTPTGAAVGARSVDAADSDKDARDQSYTWYDGDRTRTVWLHSDGAEPVFRTASGELMTLPGGVVLVLDASWDQAAVSAFFAQHGIGQSRLTEQSFGTNAFLVDTQPGLPSLELANTLAVQDGVRISSPNWRREVETR